MRDRTLDERDRQRWGADPKPPPRWLAAGMVAVVAVAAVQLVGDGWRRETARQADYRSQAEATCTQNPETYKMYPIDGRMPMDSQYGYCVAAHLSHMPSPD